MTEVTSCRVSILLIVCYKFLSTLALRIWLCVKTITPNGFFSLFSTLASWMAYSSCKVKLQVNLTCFLSRVSPSLLEAEDNCEKNNK